MLQPHRVETSANGRTLYAAACAICHKLGDVGLRDVGPPLAGIGAHAPVDLLTAIVDPNRQVEPNFWQWNITTKKGETFSGVIVSETTAALIVRNQGGDTEVKTADITTGFTGADLANLVNEAAIVATRRGADTVGLDDFTAAVERLIAGIERKSSVLRPEERQVVAYHEMGHALAASSLPAMDPVHKVSIIPRAIGALGYTLQRPTEDRYLITREELENKMVVLLGGRAAEKLVFDELSTGAADDIAKATDIARDMVTRYGMDEGLGYVVYGWFACRIEQTSAGLKFSKLTGSQRPSGLLFPEDDRHMVLLGSMALASEPPANSYGQRPDRDLVASLERIGERRWRLVIPWPQAESNLDLIELVPA